MIAAKNEEFIDRLRSQDDDAGIINSLERSRTDAMEMIGNLPQLLQDQILQSPNNASPLRPDQVEFSKLCWPRRRGKAKESQIDLRNIGARISRVHALISFVG